MSTEVTNFLREKGVATSHTTSYNPRGNGQVERLNGTLWKAVSLALRSKNLAISQWESVLCDALHSIRSLLCTATNSTPHERFLQFSRRSTNGSSLPTWLTIPGPVLLKRMARQSKYEPLVDEVELVSCNPQYAHIRLPDSKEENVALHRLAPRGEMSSPESSVSDHSVLHNLADETPRNDYPVSPSD